MRLCRSFQGRMGESRFKDFFNNPLRIKASEQKAKNLKAFHGSRSIEKLQTLKRSLRLSSVPRNKERPRESHSMIIS
jgi:hypothetical protein